MSAPGHQKAEPGEEQPFPGERVRSRRTGNAYRIGERLGEGGFGVVYACLDEWGNELAAKVLKPVASRDQLRQSAADEFERLLTLRHPCITYVYDAFEHDSGFYLITERCHIPMQDLFELEEFDGAQWLMPVARRLLQAVNYLHLNNYVHQDIHEGNLYSAFIKDDMAPDKAEVVKFKLGDLGVARLLHDVEWASTRGQWMLPPEVLDAGAGPLDTRMDIYHSALLLLQLARSEQLIFTAEQVLAGLPQQQARELDAPVGDALAHALAPRVEERTPNAMQLWQELQGQ
jgi:serine/threonine-protein kinase